ncbi:hypothetical protein X798_01991 [Onchocerca flexuosa]|uniref:Uncharacterized protein n=1 Tax=Onchocerca flexuosa TaxID=387005 RepID=A0A238C005_9BILA|nr:hypothetical protein X798_01991 [Onchocerca flexuosa]
MNNIVYALKYETMLAAKINLLLDLDIGSSVTVIKDYSVYNREESNLVQGEHNFREEIAENYIIFRDYNCKGLTIFSIAVWSDTFLIKRFQFVMHKVTVGCINKNKIRHLSYK